MAELKSCPFCGGKAELYGINNGNPFIVYCTVCGVEMGNEKAFLTYQAIEAWNTRVKIKDKIKYYVYCLKFLWKHSAWDNKYEKYTAMHRMWNIRLKNIWFKNLKKW